jgi:DNA-binding HxlR family transcriptional regulator
MAAPGLSPKRHPYHQWSPDSRALDLVGDKWTLLIVRDLLAGPRRFVELQRVLPGISTEQLRSRLHRMVADGLLTRQRYREVPPRVDYELTERARALNPIISALSRWGYAWAWSAPREGEAIDIGAVFRSAHGLLQSGRRSMRGKVELRVDERPYTIELEVGGVTLHEREATSPDTVISGSRDAWIAALGPDRVHAALDVTGNAGLAAVVLDGVSDAAALSDVATLAPQTATG